MKNYFIANLLVFGLLASCTFSPTAKPTMTSTHAPIITPTSTKTITLTPTSTPTPTIVPDSYEPNDSNDQSAFLGNIYNKGSLGPFYGSIHKLDDIDWFRVAVVDPGIFCIDTETLWFSASLDNIPLGSDYDLIVSFNNQIASSRNGGNSPESVKVSWSGRCGVDDSGMVFVEIFRDSGESANQLYQLKMKFETSY